MPIRVSRSRQNRRAVLWIAAAFALIQLGLAVAVDQFWAGVRDPEYAAKEQRLRSRLAELPGRPLVLMLGSSRTVNGLGAGMLSGTTSDERPVVFNFGLPGGGPFLQRVCLERLLQAGIQPELLLVEIVPAFFNHQRAEYLDQWMLDAARLSAAEMALLAPYAIRPLRPVQRWLHGRSLPAHRHQAELHASIEIDDFRPGFGPPAPDLSMDGHGWQPWVDEPTPELRRKWTELAHRQYDEYYRQFRLAEGPAQALRDTLSRCRHEGIHTALVLMPESEEFRLQYAAEARSGFDAFLANIQSEYALEVIDASSWVADDGFADGHHLHPVGAMAFSTRLAGAIRSVRETARLSDRQ